MHPGSRGPNMERGRQQKENSEAKRRASAIENFTSVLIFHADLFIFNLVSDWLLKLIPRHNHGHLI